MVSTPYLDEAERCHQLGFMAHGRLLAVDTPFGLIGQMPDALVLIHTPTRAAAWEFLQARPEIRWLDTSGGALRVAFDPDAPGLDEGRAFGRWLAEAGIPVTDCEPVGPLLADVFTTLSERGIPPT